MNDAARHNLALFLCIVAIPAFTLLRLEATEKRRVEEAVAHVSAAYESRIEGLLEVSSLRLHFAAEQMALSGAAQRRALLKARDLLEMTRMGYPAKKDEIIAQLCDYQAGLVELIELLEGGGR